MRVLLLADIPGWIVERCVDQMIAHLPHLDIRKGYYASMTTDEILAAASDVDLIHYGNWDIAAHWPRITSVNKPLLVSVRSHRYPAEFAAHVAPKVKVHVTSPDLADKFPGASVIPDGLMIEPQRLRVGFAGKSGPYKGTDLIEAACKRIGADFIVADCPPSRMPEWFDSIDVYCCASVNEGHGHPVMEALALNKPVVSTRCGTPWCDRLPGITWANRTVEDIASRLEQHNPASHLKPYRWAAIAPKFEALYRSML